MLLHNLIYVYMFTALLTSKIICSSIYPKGCDRSLVVRGGEQINSTSFSASSQYSLLYGAVKGIFTSNSIWIPQVTNRLRTPNPDFLEVDLGNSRTITAVKTRGYSSFYVNKFQIWLSNDGKSFLQYKAGNLTEFTSSSPRSAMHNFSCPVIARYVRFIPTAFISYIGLAVDIYGCDDVIQVNGIHSLKSVSVTSRKVTVSWIICGNFTQHSISYESVGGDYLYKNLPYDGKSEYVERIVKLDPCTQYTIIVNMTNNHSTSQQSINIITLPGVPDKPNITSYGSPKPFTASIKWEPQISSTTVCDSKIVGYRIDYQVVGTLNKKHIFVPSPGTQVQVQDLAPWLSYEFKVYSVGKYENSTLPAVARVYVEGKAPDQPVKIKTLRSDTSDSFSIWWEAPPWETVHGRIKNYAVEFRRKGSTDWKIFPTTIMSFTIRPLKVEGIYQVRVILYNEKYSKATDIREIFVGRRGPSESKELTNRFFLTSDHPKTLKVTWRIHGMLDFEIPEKVYVKVRKLGQQSWNERVVSASAAESSFTSLLPWRLYECMLTLNTTKSIYYTKTKKVLVSGSYEDGRKLIQITSLVSNEPGKALIRVKVPEQYVIHTTNTIGIRYLPRIEGAKSGEKTMYIRFKTSEQSFVIGNLDPWQNYEFYVLARLTFPTNDVKLFASDSKLLLVIGYSPGKPPANVKAEPLNSTSIRISWTKIPKQYIIGDLSEYAVFYSTENANVPKKKPVSGSADYVILTSLPPFTTYSIQVAGVNKTGGIGPLSSIVTTKTFKDPRTPVAISASPVSETEIVLKWQQPIETGQTVANFTLTLSQIPFSGKTQHVNISKKVAGEYTEKIGGLWPKTLYNIVIIAFKVINGATKYSDLSTFNRTRTYGVPPPPVPTLISAKAISSKAINVIWKSNVDLKSNWLNFSIIAVDMQGNTYRGFLFSARSDSDTRMEREFSKKLGLLQPFRSYQVHVIGIKRSFGEEVKSGKSNQIDVKTMEGAPSAPVKFKVNIVKEFQMFSWKRPKAANGEIRSYQLEIYDLEENRLVFNQTFVGKMKFKLKSGLRKHHMYKAILKAVTVKAGAPAEKTFRSAEGRPSAPRDTNGKFNGTHIIIVWKSPEEENGNILRYKIEFGTMKSDGKKREEDTYFTPGSRRTFILKDTSYGSQVQFRIAGETSVGSGPFSENSTIFIDPSKKPKPEPPPQPIVDKNAIQQNSIVIKLKPLETVFFQLQLSAYQVIVEKVNGGALQRRAVSSFPNNVSNHSTALKNGDKYYIAAEFKAGNLPKEFVVGDGKTYNGYRNAPLIPGTLYAVHVRAIAIDENGDQVYGTPSSLRLPTTAPRGGNKKSGGGIPLPVIAGVAGSLLLLIILVAIIILYLRSGSARRRAKDKRESFDMELLKLRTQVDPDEQRPISLTGDFPLYPDHLPVTVANYNNHVSKMLRNKASGFRCEYNQLEMGKEYSWEIAHLQENKPKNRFANIVAYDHARVILGKIDFCPGSDYINASYIDGYMKPNAYVATQGPLPGTFNDFWRMVWELRSSVIVMLTNLQEKNKLKCHKYWPDDCIEYGEVIVAQTKKEVYADYIIRTFLLDRTDSPESREVKHFHFTVWPDHGVPKYATALLAFRRRVRSYNLPDSGPTVVHCSAGVGRTGTYIALDATLDRMNVNGDIDVFNFVAAMRTRRIAMVQTEEQYIFIHNAILDSVQCGNTEITAQDLRIMINKLEQHSPETKMNGFEKEWKTLNNVSPIPSKSSCSLAALPENMPKNRNQNACILPADNSLVRLFTIEDDESTSYINAVYVDGYKQRNLFILTQAPMKNTVFDFWRMLCEHKSASVVVLCSMDEGEDFVKFWPEMHIKEYEMITVEYLSKARGSDETSLRYASKHGEKTDLITRQFRVEDSRFPEHPMMVKLFQYVGWNETKVPSSCTNVIQLITQLERWQQQSGNGPITVVCSDGIGRSGTFAALNAVLERLKVEQVVDVFQAIKAMRIQRAHLVKTLDQYKFIYNAVEEYLDAFDDYANFK